MVDAIWQIDRTAGSGSIEVNIFWDPALEGSIFNTFPNTMIGISRYNGSQWENAVSLFADNSANFVIADFSNFSPFGVTQINTPLASKFGPVSAYEQQKGIQVNWKIYSEVNVQHYTVERSADGVNFGAIGTVAALNSPSPKDYGFFDVSPLNGNSFYRIRSTDMGGAVTYSSIVKVSLNGTGSDVMALYPNPVINNVINLQQSNLEKGNYTIRIFNTAGMLITQELFKHTGGAFSLQLPLSSKMLRGNYILVTEHNGVQKKAVPFTVQ
jgi:hypothetical protein